MCVLHGQKPRISAKLKAPKKRKMHFEIYPLYGWTWAKLFCKIWGCTLMTQTVKNQRVQGEQCPSWLFVKSEGATEKWLMGLSHTKRCRMCMCHSGSSEKSHSSNLLSLHTEMRWKTNIPWKIACHALSQEVSCSPFTLNSFSDNRHAKERLWGEVKLSSSLLVSHFLQSSSVTLSCQRLFTSFCAPGDCKAQSWDVCFRANHTPLTQFDKAEKKG